MDLKVNWLIVRNNYENGRNIVYIIFFNNIEIVWDIAHIWATVHVDSLIHHHFRTQPFSSVVELHFWQVKSTVILGFTWQFKGPYKQPIVANDNGDRSQTSRSIFQPPPTTFRQLHPHFHPKTFLQAMLVLPILSKTILSDFIIYSSIIYGDSLLKLSLHRYS